MAARIRVVEVLSDIQRAELSEIGNKWAAEIGVDLPGERRGAKEREVGLYDADMAEIDGRDDYYSDADDEAAQTTTELPDYERCNLPSCVGKVTANLRIGDVHLRLCRRHRDYYRLHRRFQSHELDDRWLAQFGLDYLTTR